MLPEHLKALRIAAGKTVRDVREALGVPKATAYAWESEGARPEPEQLQRLLDLFEASDEDRLTAWRLRSAPRVATDGATEAA